MIPADLQRAIDELVHELNIGDYVYNVKERELKGWEGPRVQAFAAAVEVLTRHANPKKP